MSDPSWNASPLALQEKLIKFPSKVLGTVSDSACVPVHALNPFRNRMLFSSLQTEDTNICVIYAFVAQTFQSHQAYLVNGTKVPSLMFNQKSRFFCVNALIMCVHSITVQTAQKLKCYFRITKHIIWYSPRATTEETVKSLLVYFLLISFLSTHFQELCCSLGLLQNPSARTFVCPQ